MARNVGDIKTEVLVRLSADTTTGYYTDTILNTWLNEAHRFCVSYKKWSLTEGKATTTWSSATEAYSYPETWHSDSIKLLQVGDKRLQKINFEDYQIFREKQSTASDRIWSDFAGLYYINPNIDVSGTITVWGHYVPVDVDTSDNTSTTLFSNIDEEGNFAIVNEILSYAFTREREMDKAQLHHQKAIEILEGIWNRYQVEQFEYQTKDRGMFKRIDVLRGAFQEEIFKRDQFF